MSSRGTPPGCIEPEDLSAFVDGELPPDDALRVSAHVAACSACSALLARMGGTSRAVASLPRERASEELVREVARRAAAPEGAVVSPASAVSAATAISARAAGRGASRFTRWAAAAAVILGAIIVFQVTQEVQRQSPAPAELAFRQERATVVVPPPPPEPGPSDDGRALAMPEMPSPRAREEAVADTLGELGAGAAPADGVASKPADGKKDQSLAKLEAGAAGRAPDAELAADFEEKAAGEDRQGVSDRDEAGRLAAQQPASPPPSAMAQSVPTEAAARSATAAAAVANAARAEAERSSEMRESVARENESLARQRAQSGESRRAKEAPARAAAPAAAGALPGAITPADARAPESRDQAVLFDGSATAASGEQDVALQCGRKRLRPEQVVAEPGAGLVPPVLMKRVEPEWPTGETDAVVIEVVIEPEGTVSPCLLPDSPELAAALRRALSQWRYRPAQLDGHAQAVRETLTLQPPISGR